MAHVPAPDDFDAWRDRARAFVRAGIPPEQIIWVEPGATAGLLAFGDNASLPPDDGGTVRASKQFLQVARSVILHSASDRFDLLYRLLWRLQRNPHLMDDQADPDVVRAGKLAKAVRRDIHKMHAFVRFRLVEGVRGDPDQYVAWFEPDHHILRATAGFFVRRFANMRWSILTPKGSLHWDGEILREGPPADRSHAPEGDMMEDMWRTYYASTFNPARLKVGAMLKEMPRRYWKNLPEAELIPGLVAGAQAREAAMVDAGEAPVRKAVISLAEIAQTITACRDCPIGALSNQAVAGEGRHGADPLFSGLMIVGEQPGDEEDLSGRPFVGPAGQLLDQHLAQVGIDRRRAYVTNAVKHFKFTQRGRRRIHQSPTVREIDTCRWWLENERSLVAPRLVLALGASAARGILGRTVSIAAERGQPFPLADGSELWITFHPSYLLRQNGEAGERQTRLFEADLRAVAERLARLQGPELLHPSTIC